MRTYQVTDNGRSMQIGVDANDLNTLKKKASTYLCLHNWESYRCYVASNGIEIADDGTFEKLKPHTLLIIAKDGEVIVNDFQFHFSQLSNNQPRGSKVSS